MIHSGGDLMLNNGHWLLRAEPHVAMMAKRWFPSIPPSADGLLTLNATPEVSRHLEAFCDLFDVNCASPDRMKAMADEHRAFRRNLSELLAPDYVPGQYELKLPPRDYQRLAADWFLRVKGGLLGDTVGIGKSCSTICIMAAGVTLPCVVVCPTHIQRQWQAEIYKFCPRLVSHVITKRALYDLPLRNGRGPDVIIINYQKLDAWSGVLAGYCKMVAFDEVQELRRDEIRSGEPTKKYAAAKHLAGAVEYRIGLSGTPIMNFGGEIFNVLDVLRPGCLGSWSEFSQAHCSHDSDNGRSRVRLRDPSAFGNWLRREHIMLRRTREDVGRELDPLTKITHTIDADPEALDKIEDKAGELARIILGGGSATGKRGEKMLASEEFSSILRQATGVAKAPHVAAFVEMLVESGEKVVLFGWHHAVFGIWMNRLKQYEPAAYTGVQSEQQKEISRRRFIDGKTPIFMCSLRSGAGLDGLQFASSTAVFGELDWAPGQMEQCVGRLLREGQTKPVTAHFLVADDGIDPIMCDTLALKTDQVEGIRADGHKPLEQRVDSHEAMRELARKYAGRAKRLMAIGD